MSFDQNSNLPVIQFRKWTTRVNVWMVVLILLFFAAGALGVVIWRHNKPPSDLSIPEVPAQP